VWAGRFIPIVFCIVFDDENPNVEKHLSDRILAHIAGIMYVQQNILLPFKTFQSHFSDRSKRFTNLNSFRHQRVIAPADIRRDGEQTVRSRTLAPASHANNFPNSCGEYS